MRWRDTFGSRTVMADTSDHLSTLDVSETDVMEEALQELEEPDVEERGDDDA